MKVEGSLEDRFRAVLSGEGGLRDGDRVVVALSGGLDSVTLLHLLRFVPGLPAAEPVAAHFDHRMRPGSGADAAWVRGLARAWDVPLRTEVAPRVPRGEADARELRYGFLESVRREVGASWTLTAHHADDQAETVLFRALRGTGVEGLAGIPARRAPSVWRPLLGFCRRELEAYAGAHGVCWREDPTNADHRFARNALRAALADIERRVAPGARRSLVRLARHARSDARAWRAALPALLAGLDVREEAGGVVHFERTSLLATDPALRPRLLRALVRRAGGGLDAAGTRLAVEFTSAGASGARVALGGGLVLARELDRLVIGPAAAPGGERVVRIEHAEPGSAELLVGGRRRRVVWGGPETIAGGGRREAFPARGLRFPLVFRGRRPGDRMRLDYGSKKVKKLLLEARVPPADRARVAVLADAADEVLWIPGIARSSGAREAPGEDLLYIAIDEDADE